MEEKTINGEITAAISLALYEYEGYTSHVMESGKLTLDSESTEWSSKLRTQRQIPEVKF